jgi:hypothetical protein
VTIWRGFLAFARLVPLAMPDLHASQPSICFHPPQFFSALASAAPEVRLQLLSEAVPEEVSERTCKVTLQAAAAAAVSTLASQPRSSKLSSM